VAISRDVKGEEDGNLLQTVLRDGSGVTTITLGQEASWQRLP
jgi:hypothetical protein